MHYKNGRKAFEGDKVINIETGEVGILYNTTGGDACNGYIAPIPRNNYVIQTKHCLHMDDLRAANVPNLMEPRPAGE